MFNVSCLIGLKLPTSGCYRGELFRGPGGILEIETAKEKLRVDFADAAREFRDDTASKAAKTDPPPASIVDDGRRHEAGHRERWVPARLTLVTAH